MLPTPECFGKSSSFVLLQTEDLVNFYLALQSASLQSNQHSGMCSWIYVENNAHSLIRLEFQWVEGTGQILEIVYLKLKWFFVAVVVTSNEEQL